MKEITFGSDPEFMLQDDSGEFRSAIGIVKGTKEKRLRLGEHEAYYDNVLAEVAIKPGSSKEEVVQNFRDCFNQLSNLVNPLRLTILPAGKYPDEEVQHRDAQKFGCDADFCAYTLSVNAAPPVPPDGFRTAGGHIHIGFEGGVGEELDTDWKRLWIVRMLDLFLGVPSIFMDNSKEAIVRRELYGKAGCHRRCVDYGVEYRSMSNFWLASPNLVEMVYDISKFCVDIVLNENHEDFWDKQYDPEELSETINNGDMETANKKFMPILKNSFPKDLMKQIELEIERDKPYNFYNEWGF